jgi:CubicO group peptidase (beta-lactamase class C family)
MIAGGSATLESLARDVAEVLPGEGSGAVLALVEGDRTSFAVAGGPDLTEDTLFEFGSITKIVTAQLVAQLALEGALDLDESINRFLSDPAKGPQWADVTVRQLCTHASGLSGWPPNLGPVRIVLSGRLDDPFGGYGEAQLVAGMRRTAKPRIEARWVYSNYGFAILGRILEHVTGRPYEALVAERVLDPFGMDSATTDGWSSASIAPPLTRRGRASSHWTFDAFAPAGALRGSLRDGVRLLKGSMFACEGADAISAASCFAQQPAGFDRNEASEMGLGWVLTRRGGETAIWHNGGTGGYSTFLGFNRASRTGVVILTNVEGLREIDGLALERLFGAGTALGVEAGVSPPVRLARGGRDRFGTTWPSGCRDQTPRGAEDPISSGRPGPSE